MFEVYTRRELVKKKSEDAKYLAWLELLDTWCSRHGLTREQAVSVLFDDSASAGVAAEQVGDPVFEDCASRFLSELVSW